MSFFSGGGAVPTRVAHVHIDGEALTHNLKRARDLAQGSRVMAVVKADAYGHGMMAAVKNLSEADGFALAMLGEAIALRKAGILQPLTVFQGFADNDELKAMLEFDLQPVIHQSWQIELLEQLASKDSGSSMDVWLKIDTGMHRLGIPLEQVSDSLARLEACSTVDTIRVMSHFANADQPGNTYNTEQLSVFSDQVQGLEYESSMANSAALLTMPASLFDWVRPGIMLYGSSPVVETSASELDLRPVMNFESRLCAINLLKKNDVIGYGSTWRCPEDMAVGIVAAGYADGYPRQARSGTPVWINDHLCPLLGRVSMDSLCIDLRGVEASVGDRVVLWGKELSVDEVASKSDTIGYELLCRAGKACK